MTNFDYAPFTGEGGSSRGAVARSLVDAKGDLLVATADNTLTRLPIGVTNGHVLTVDSAEPTGQKWAAAGGGGGAIAVVKTSDESVTSSIVVQDDNQLAVPIAISETLVINMTLFVIGNAVGDFRIAIDKPAGGVVYGGVYGSRSDALIAMYPSGSVVWNGEDASIELNGVGMNTIMVSLSVVNSTTAGSVTLRWAQKTSDATATTVKAGSNLVANKVA